MLATRAVLRPPTPPSAKDPDGRARSTADHTALGTGHPDHTALGTGHPDQADVGRLLSALRDTTCV
ncbi:hypothetical protein [Kitasatospora sp. NPDC088783]|uniref:hypothetical protein n=1 Tax=Kitasatospora sp. NPDC088783 TaxID=3364077 RepID=UPI00381FC79A